MNCSMSISLTLCTWTWPIERNTFFTQYLIDVRHVARSENLEGRVIGGAKNLGGTPPCPLPTCLDVLTQKGFDLPGKTK